MTISDRGIAAGFRLPPGMSFAKQRLGPHDWAYVFTDDELGPLGRIVVQSRDDGRSQFALELARGHSEELASLRFARFDPVATELVRRLEAAVTCRKG